MYETIQSVLAERTTSVRKRQFPSPIAILLEVTRRILLILISQGEHPSNVSFFSLGRPYAVSEAWVGCALAGPFFGDAIHVSGSTGRWLADGRAARCWYRLSAELCLHDGYRELLPRFLYHPHHECYANQYLKVIKIYIQFSKFKLLIIKCSLWMFYTYWDRYYHIFFN